MSNSFRDRLKRLHDAHHRGRETGNGPGGVYTADDAEVSEDEEAEEMASTYGGWQGLGAKRCDDYDEPLWIIETRCPQDLEHGRWTLAGCRDVPHTELVRLDREAPDKIRPEQLLYMDVETTGLGPKAYAFMVGIGFWRDDEFVVDHLVIDEPDHERALLECFADHLARRKCLVTFNGKRFDVPLLARRFEAHEITDPFDDTAHVDLLPLARRVFPGLNRYALSHLENFVLDFERVDDVPGREIPKRWGRFQRNQNPDLMRGVVEHNRHDIVSMTALVAAAITGDDPRERRDCVEETKKSSSWSLPAGTHEKAGGIAGKLMRSYRLRGKFARHEPDYKEQPPADEPSETSEPPAPAPAPTTAGGENPSRIRELHSACSSLIDQDLWREAFPMLCELVALSPTHDWGLEKLAEYYRREGNDALANEIEGRRHR